MAAFSAVPRWLAWLLRLTLAAAVTPILLHQTIFLTDYAGGYVGMSFRFFDPKTKLWSIYWADSRNPGPLEPPVVGAFDGDVGIFEGPDTFEGRPIVVRYTWSGVTTSTPRWEQAFSEDGGETWETNFVSEFTRADDE